jgi:hypothetical protein
MLFWVENDIFLWICLFWPTSSINDVYFSITISRGTPFEKPWCRSSYLHTEFVTMFVTRKRKHKKMDNYSHAEKQHLWIPLTSKLSRIAKTSRIVSKWRCRQGQWYVASYSDYEGAAWSLDSSAQDLMTRGQDMREKEISLQLCLRYFVN